MPMPRETCPDRSRQHESAHSFQPRAAGPRACRVHLDWKRPCSPWQSPDVRAACIRHGVEMIPTGSLGRVFPPARGGGLLLLSPVTWLQPATPWGAGEAHLTFMPTTPVPALHWLPLPWAAGTGTLRGAVPSGGFCPGAALRASEMSLPRPCQAWPQEHTHPHSHSHVPPVLRTLYPFCAQSQDWTSSWAGTLSCVIPANWDASNPP